MRFLFAKDRAARYMIEAGLARLRLLALAVACLFACSAFAQESLTVVTGYPDDIAAAYQHAFEAAHPGISVEIVKKSGREAFAFLSAPDHGGADVYWAASSNFPKLRDLGAFATLRIDRSQLPGKIGPEQISDPDNKFEAFELAGYGLAYGPQALWKSKSAPTSWHDAAAADLEGQIIMPIASRVGFSPALYEIILQGEGWDKGWALLSEISGNAVLTDTPRGLDPIEAGHAALGLTIDFIALNAAAHGQAIALAYPQKTAFLPAYVAELAGARHAKSAEIFIHFLLSQESQKLLLTPGINRYPVRPDAYAATGAATNPFKLPASMLVAFDPQLAETRHNLDAALFDATIVTPHEKLVALWHKIHAAEKQLAAHPDAKAAQHVAEARKLAGFIPVAQADVDDPAFLARLGQGSGKIPADMVAKWNEELDAAYTKAAALFAEIPN
jgi:ABC-type Fe3+ transport system substrate-binding protein